ncbi:33049_t:CDS:1, partial [Racocetra persica]
NMKLLEDSHRRYEDEADQINRRRNRENEVLKAIVHIEESMNVDLCFVLDCTISMSNHIKAAKEHILKVASYVNSNNSNIEFWVGFCGYRDHSDGNDRLQNFDFTNSLEKFQTYLSNKVEAKGDDLPEDVLGGLNAAITQMIDVHNEFLLTDPAIHCIDLLRFGTTNLGKSGIQKCFLAKHKCNDI